MTRLPRRLIGAIVFLVIVGNLWYLSQRSGVKQLDNLGEPYLEPERTERPVFSSHKAGDNWNTQTEEKPHASPVTHGEAHAPITVTDKISPVETATKGASPAKPKHGETIGNDKGQRPKNYDTGMALIKKTLDKIAEINPGTGPLRNYNRHIQPDTELDSNKELPATSYVMGLYLQLTDEEIETLKASHEKMMRELPKTVQEGAFTGRGIVMTGGGKYFPMVLTAIKWVRETDKNIPIEVFMADKSEYEEHICDGLFSKINVECRVIQDIYGEALSAKLESKYALKPLAILGSKFDDIYFMDADSYPSIDLNEIFEWDVYKETGLILNADYWPRYISPNYYKIVGIELGGRARGDPNSDALLQSDRENAVPGKSTESGQIFVKKSEHIQSLLLAMYYNLYGPDVYFPLLMQGGHGEGDKDTYAAAAIICGESYYQTQRRPVTLGQHASSGYKGFAMCQPNPIVDYQIFEEGKHVTEQFFALHANSIKSNARYLLEGYNEPMRGAPPLRQHRFFGDMDNVRRELNEDVDVEERLFRTMGSVACDWAVKEKYIPRDWENQDVERLCRILQKHTVWSKANPDVDAPDDAAYWIDLDN